MNDNSNPAPESSRENYRLTFSEEREKKEMLMIFSPLCTIIPSGVIKTSTHLPLFLHFIKKDWWKMLFISSLKSKKLIVIIKNWDESDIIVFTKWERQAFAVWFGKKKPWRNCADFALCCCIITLNNRMHRGHLDLNGLILIRSLRGSGNNIWKNGGEERRKHWTQIQRLFSFF